MIKIIYRSVLLFILCFGIISCEDEGGTSDEFDRKSMLENIGSNIIFPAYQGFGEQTVSLSLATENFKNNLSETELEKVQSMWKATKSAWKLTEMYDFGPVDSKALKTSIDNWSTNTFSIEDAIENGNEFDNAYITSLGSSSKGLPAIEYLIFDSENGNETILELLTNDPKRLSFLVALSSNLETIGTELSDDWDPQKGNYLHTFIDTDGKDIGSSTNILANQIIILTEVLKNDKVGIPLGKKSLGELLPKNLEAWRSAYSLELLDKNILALEQVFTGGSQIGFDDYLDNVDARHNGELLSKKIKDQFTAIKSARNQITGPLINTMETEKTEIENLYNALQQQVIYLKTDMMSSLGLLVTFSDNDGD